MKKKLTPDVLLIRTTPLLEPRFKMVASTLHEIGFNPLVILWDRGFLGKVSSVEDKGSYLVQRVHLKAASGKFSLIPIIPIWWAIQTILIFKFRPRIIHCGDLISVVPAIIIGSILKIKIVYDIFDFYSQMRILDLKSSFKSVFYFLVRWLEKLAIRFAEIVILPHEQQSFLLEGAYPKLRITSINHSPENVEFNSSFNRIEHIDKLIVFYCGYLEAYRGVDTILEAMEKIDVAILFISGFGTKAPLIDRISHNSKNIEYFGFVSRERMFELMGKIDVFFVSYDPNMPVCNVASPSKLYEAMMFGKPVIVSKNTIAERIVQKEKCGLSVEYGNIEELRKTIVMLAKNKKLRKEIGKNARAAYENKYSWDNNKRRLILAYRTLI